MKNLYFTGILLIIILLSSCTITQEFHFNKDFSGSYISTIDMSQFIDMMNSLDSSDGGTGEFIDSLDLILTQAVKKLETTGVRNLKSGWNNNKALFISYDFANIDELNKALNKSGMNENNTSDGEDFIFFIRKGKTLIYKGIPPKETAAGGKDLGAMKDYYKYRAVFSFERRIKKSDNPKYKISEDKHKAVLSAPFFDITKKDFNTEVRFKLK
ncbi:MAG: hypothetical protein L3J74_13620 [Bacteroidales bacterium]|nr:hypothetical protein [Bacteroidales bacterium]